MREFRIVAFLMVVAFPALLYAQQSGAGATGTSTTVENQSEQGGFIGGGAPDNFVGVHEIYLRNTRTTRTAGTTRQTVATARPRTTTTAAQRQASTATRTATAQGTAGQTIRSATSLDSDIVVPSIQRPLPEIETNLSRIRGVQDGQVSFTSLPTGTTAVITGTVSTERQRRVAQQLLLLEPGINRVENLLEVR